MFVGFIPENHDWCLDQLLSHETQILAEFPEQISSAYSMLDVVMILSEEFARFGFFYMPNIFPDAKSYILLCATSFAERNAYGLAFGVSVMGLKNEDLDEDTYSKIFAWRQKVLDDLVKYEKELKVFEPLLKKGFKNLNGSAFNYLDMMIHNHYSNITYDPTNVNECEKRVDFYLHFLRKRYELKFLPNGITPYLYRLLQISMMFLKIARFRQVRHLLAVVAELMKAVDQDTQLFRKLQEMFYMIKTLHWARILAASELGEVVSKAPVPMPDVKLSTPRERVIDFGIPLPDGEDPELPVELILTEAARAPIYKKLLTYQEELKRSKIPHVASIYRSILICDINYYNANTNTPFCCGKHDCRHPHDK